LSASSFGGHDIDAIPVFTWGVVHHGLNAVNEDYGWVILHPWRDAGLIGFQVLGSFKKAQRLVPILFQVAVDALLKQVKAVF
jgi:hypothetical protein